MTRVYLIRHAEAEGNLYRIANGHYNSTLTDKGWKQVAALAKRFEDKSVDEVYSSDLYRAQATATAIYKAKGLPLHATEDLREICLGDMEGTAWSKWERDDPDNCFNFSHRPDLYHPVGAGETYEQVRERMLKTMLQIARVNDGKSVAVVSHGCAIRTLMAAIDGLSLEEQGKTPYGENASITLLEIENDKIHVVYRYSDSHLIAAGLTTAVGKAWSGVKLPKKENGLILETMDVQEDGEKYLFCRAEYMKSMYGHLQGFDGPGMLLHAIDLVKKYPAAVMRATKDGEMVGMFQLVPEYGEEDHAGYIDFMYLMPPYRNQGLGIQLLGPIVGFYRLLNRDKLRFIIEPNNVLAITFYKKHGFVEVGTLEDKRIIMQKFIGFRPL